MIKAFIERWLYSIARELKKEAEWCNHNGHNREAVLLICIAAALNRADGTCP